MNNLVPPDFAVNDIIAELSIRYDIEPYDVFKLLVTIDESRNYISDSVTHLTTYMLYRTACLLYLDNELSLEGIQMAQLNHCIQYERENPDLLRRLLDGDMFIKDRFAGGGNILDKFINSRESEKVSDILSPEEHNDMVGLVNKKTVSLDEYKKYKK